MIRLATAMVPPPLQFKLLYHVEKLFRKWGGSILFHIVFIMANRLKNNIEAFHQLHRPQ